MSIKYYNEKADEFFDSTINVDMKSLYDKFEEYLPDSAYILDAGCGSGRDTKYFLNQGYNVDAFDASVEMVKMASEYTGIKVKQMFFEDIDAINQYDGIWSCASLLHVSKNEIHDVFKKFIRALKPKGIWYMSFKLGDQERTKNGRYFNDYTIDNLRDLINLFDKDLEINDIWITVDSRPERDENWVNAIVIKCKEVF